MYYAKLDENNVVIDVIVADADFISAIGGVWIQYDVDGVSPKNAAVIGGTWREDLGGFVAPQPFASWALNESTCKWEPPTPMPQDGNYYRWDEPTLSWVAI